jgi:hypothetical protein
MINFSTGQTAQEPLVMATVSFLSRGLQVTSEREYVKYL